jgi:ferredoxin-type protein NapH
MKRLPKFATISAIVVLTLFLFAASFDVPPQANTAEVLDNDSFKNAAYGGQVPLLYASSLSSPKVFSESPLPCYGPCIQANVSRVEVNLGDNVTVTGQIHPPSDNVTVRVTFTRPDYTWIDHWVKTDPLTGDFNATQTLDTVGFWNIFPIYGHISDRLYANVTDPANPNVPQPTPLHPLPPFKTNWNVIGLGIAGGILGIVAVATGLTRKTRSISSLRLFVQIGFVFMLFFGVFIDHQNIPIPAEQIAPHEVLIGVGPTSPMPDGFPLPVLACWFPCGRVVTCPLWQIQAYIYPFWNSGRGWGVYYDLTGLERLAIVVGIVILGSVLLGRLWCGWICPFGLYVDLISRLRKALKIEHRSFSRGFNERFHQLSYVILALMVILSVIFASQVIAGTQLIPGTENGGFINTYFSAPFCQVCPMKPLCILTQTGVGLMKPDWTFGPTTGQFWQLGQYLTSLNLAIFGVVTAAAFFFRRSWCRICPLGGLIALFNRFAPFKWVSGVRLDKIEEKCTKCGMCKRVCPTQVTEVYEYKGGDVTTSQCILCMRCVEMCPEKDCLQFKVAGKTVCRSRNWTAQP